MSQTLTGIVTSTATQKTVTVKIERKLRHPRYLKVIVRSKKLQAHNDDPTVKVGDTVEITTTRPVSKSKHYRVSQKIQA